MGDSASSVVERIEAALRAWARGFYPSGAAVELLIAHGAWLNRADFRRRTIWISDEGPVCIAVDWVAARDLTGRAKRH
ncbi:hypothetical protein [Pengzhenrongella sicca]|uniref:Uncharacterized protein n=1 Tax=Pengzhenrongella sicca TaxID=2819238 RepID=A0A8A4ZKF6_9MICO|nr:hypothetical protein [Pengzhenrongella sicca]QTE30068.1 hypothetical protein J4E96_03325 [Pengzhenrongella sicca]